MCSSATSIPSNSICTHRRRRAATSGRHRCCSSTTHAAQPIFDIFRGVDTEADIIPTVRVEVRNGTGTSGQGKTVLNDLADQGFVAVRSTDARDFRNPGTVILYAPGQQLAAANVARYIDGDPTFQEDASLSDVSVALVTGNDFTAIRTDPRPLEDFQSFLDNAASSSTETSVEDTTTTPAFVPEAPPASPAERPTPITYNGDPGFTRHEANGAGHGTPRTALGVARMAKFAVIGTGYVGLTTGAASPTSVTTSSAPTSTPTRSSG